MSTVAGMPVGLLYQPDFIEAAEEEMLLNGCAGLDYTPFVNMGYESKRLVASFGQALSFRSGTQWAERLPPEWMLGLLLRVRSWLAEAAPLAACSSAALSQAEESEVSTEYRGAVCGPELAHVLVTRYPPGAQINWHRDAPQFELICGLSLGAACRLRLRPCRGLPEQTETPPRASAPEPAGMPAAARPRRSISLRLEPRSLYLLSGAARYDWEHSIAPLQAERYSITFRTQG